MAQRPTSQRILVQKAEKKAILSYHAQHPDEGYRRLADMMLDENIAAAARVGLSDAKIGREAEKMGKKALKKGQRLQTAPKTPCPLAH